MKYKNPLIFLLLSLSYIASSCASNRVVADVDPFIINAKALEENKSRIANGDRALSAPLNQLIEEADQMLSSKNNSVVEKKRTPPSGDIHDYLSMATYYWPDPSKPDGLPYIHKDGEANPEIGEIKDNSYLIRMVKQVNTLALAFYYTEDEKYAEKAIEKVKVWFINNDTKMNPNLNHSQYIPGRNDGRVVGLIDTRDLVDLIDGLQILKKSASWDRSLEENLKAWFSEFSDWLQYSEMGESAVEKLKNNIATAYYMQIIAYSLYSGNEDNVRSIVRNNLPALIEQQVDNEGKPLLEVTRANAWAYSEANSNYWFKIVRLVEHVDIDLLNEEDQLGQSLSRALSWMEPFTKQEKEWTYGSTRTPKVKATARRLNNGRSRLNRAASARRPNAAQTSKATANTATLEESAEDVSPYEMLSEFN